MITTLPASSFVPFETRKLANPKLIWSDISNEKQAQRDLLLERFSFSIPSDTDGAGKHLDITKTFLAERYGGAGIVNNGGGVRCGFGDGLQIKGMGQNPLAGKKKNFWYSHGGATLEEGIREAVWGEVCAVALPYGAIRVHAVIATGNEVAFDSPQGKCMVPGALIVRDAGLRPAHYMRAPFYRPNDTMAMQNVADVERTKLALEQIGNGFQSILYVETPSRLDAAYMNAGLQELAKRCAIQVAAARIKKIVHGALSCSNISLDGRFLDYGTITTVSDYRRIMVARGQPDMLNEHTQLQTTLGNLAFYCHKFLPDHAKNGLISSIELTGYFQQVFQQRVAVEFLKLTGIPEHALLAIESPTLASMLNVINEIIKVEDCEPFKLYTPSMDQALWKMPEKMGRYHLNAILQRASLCSTPEQINTEIAALLDDDALRQRFTKAYWQLRQAYLSVKTATLKKNSALFMAINAYRLNCNFPELYRPNLVRKINAILETDEIEEKSTVLIRDLSCKAKTLLADPHDNHIDLFFWTGKKILFDETSCRTHSGQSIPVDAFVDLMDHSIFTTGQKLMLVTLCK